MLENLSPFEPKPNISKMPDVMGILNVTPDSFSDGGHFIDLDKAIDHAYKMIDHGVDIIDIGGESTRPGAEIITVDEEIKRTIPLIKAIRKFSDIRLSIDTNKAKVMKQAVDSGATMINDVYALQKEHALETASKLNVPVCLMHMQGTPQTMQDKPSYDSIIDEVKHFLRHRVFDAQTSGIDKKNIIIDPGFGFGKTVEQNFLMLSRLADFKDLGARLLVGISRKSMLGAVTGTKVEHRLSASLSAAVIAALKGADILRVHDVLETKQALAIVNQI